MSEAALMVYVELESQRRIELAADLAGRLRARLIGIAARPPMPLVTGEDAAIDATLFAEAEVQARAFLDRAGERFRTIVGNGPASVEWRAAPDFPNNFVIRESRAADLIVIGQSSTPPHPLDVGGFLLRAGRPVLVVPNALASFAARHAVVAWKDTREARRVLCDALPLLQLAENVVLVEVCEWGAEDKALHRLKDVSGFLTRHGIASVTERVVPDVAIAGDVLVRFAQDTQADLIVAGAYGHSRLGEWMFGGVTRDLLTKSPICCLFSH
jgi:nucleotide-binding universal stress UspA family protein